MFVRMLLRPFIEFLDANVSPECSYHIEISRNSLFIFFFFWLAYIIRMKAAGGDHSLIEFGLLRKDEEENITQGDAKKRKLNAKEPDPQNQID